MREHPKGCESQLFGDLLGQPGALCRQPCWLRRISLLSLKARNSNIHHLRGDFSSLGVTFDALSFPLGLGAVEAPKPLRELELRMQSWWRGWWPSEPSE